MRSRNATPSDGVSLISCRGVKLRRQDKGGVSKRYPRICVVVKYHPIVKRDGRAHRRGKGSSKTLEATMYAQVSTEIKCRQKTAKKPQGTYLCGLKLSGCPAAARVSTEIRNYRSGRNSGWS